MVICPTSTEVEKFLTLDERVAVQQERGGIKFVNKKTPMFGPAVTADGRSAVISHHGLWRSLAESLEEKGYTVSITDVRKNLIGEPKVVDAMIGLRPWQKPWMLRALYSGESGLIGAPTRYGKSYGMTSLCRAFPKAKTVVTAPGIDLCQQIYEHFKTTLGKLRDIRAVYTGSRNRMQGPDITVCSMDSLEKMDDDTELLIVDEPHAVVSDTRIPGVTRFAKARKYGFGATLKGRSDRRDRLIEGLIGPVISNVTYRDAVEQGAISPMKVVILEIPFSKDTVPGNPNRDTVYKRLLTESSRTAGLVRKLMFEVIPQDWQTMAFIRNEKQAEFYMQHAMPETGTIAMAKRLAKKERDAVTAGIASGEILRVLASKIYVQGVTFPDLRVVVNLEGGGANTGTIQKPGRLLQTRLGKNYGVMFDFKFVCRDKQLESRQKPPYGCIEWESVARIAAYREIGYDVEFVKDAERAREIVLAAYEPGK